MARETGVQLQVKLYQRLKNWYLMPPCLTLSIIRYASRIKWNNPVVLAIEKGTFVWPSTTVANFTSLIYIYIYTFFKKKNQRPVILGL